MKNRLNIGIAIVCLVITVFVFYSNIRDGKRLEVVYQFKDDGRVYGLYPSDRVSQTYREQGTGNVEQKFQEIVASPVYLDIRYWQDFKRARVEIEYEKDPEVDFRIGYKTGKGFEWKLFDVDSHGNPGTKTNKKGFSDREMKGGGQMKERNRQKAVFDVLLDGEYVPRNNVHRWIFSSKNVQGLNSVIRIYGITFTFTR